MKIILSSVLIVLYSYCAAQQNTMQFNLQAQASVTDKEKLPFWMKSNQFGDVPLTGASAGFLAGAKKDYNEINKLFDWGGSFQGRLNTGSSVNVILVEGYGKLKLGIFELRAGRSRETFGLADTLLTSGNFAISGNALGIPKVQISIPEFYSIPFAGNFFSIKGNYAHGWLGEVPIQFAYKRVDKAKALLHQKSLYLRLGKPDSRIKIYLGVNDNVIWGNNEKIFPKNEFTLSPLQEYKYVVLSKKFEYSQVGNHLGTVDIAMEHKTDKNTVRLYRQSFFDKDGLKHLANIADGLNGVSLTRTPSSESFNLKKLVFELLYTKNQAAKSVSSLNLLGYEDYYNNYIYTQGWSYKSAGLGSPFITKRDDAEGNIPGNEKEYFINNRVLAFHLGSQGMVGKWDYIAKVSYSLNYGTYTTEASFGKKTQFSCYLETKRQIGNKLYLGFTGALDAGKLLGTSAGLLTKLEKRF